MNDLQIRMIAKYGNHTTGTDYSIWWNYTYLLNFAWIFIFFGTFTIVLFYAFPKNRKFPVSVQIWPSILDVVLWILEISKWGPYSDMHEEWNFRWTEPTCRLLQGWIAFVDSGQAICTVFLSFVIYNSVVRKKEMGYREQPRYLWGMVAIFWSYTAFWTLLMSIAPKFVPKTGPTTCALDIKANNLFYPYALMFQYGVCAVINLYFLGHSIRYIREVWALARANHNNKSTALARLQLRFALVLMLQALPRLNWQIGNILTAFERAGMGRRPPWHQRFGQVFTFTCYMIDNLLLLVLNRPLRMFLRRRYRDFQKTISSRFSTSDTLFDSSATDERTQPSGGTGNTEDTNNTTRPNIELSAV